jgi:hypothetical protein
MVDTVLTPARLWKQLTGDERLKLARAFWLDEEATEDQLQAVMLIAQRKNFRSKTVVAMDVDRKARHLATLPNLTDALAARVLTVYHLATQRPMMGTFLDALGIAHDNGIIREDGAKPDPEKIGPAVAALTSQYPHEDVKLYLMTLLCQDPETWGALAETDGIG